jgi:iron complex transport system substrate-binding protein
MVSMTLPMIMGKLRLPYYRIIVCAAMLCGCAQTAPTASPPPSPPRIVSLAPSITEIAYAIGCGGLLVGDTRYDDYPPAATTLPHVADLTHVDLERLTGIAPTDVLALHDQEKEGSEIARSLNVHVEYLPNRNLDDLYADITGVGSACGREAQAGALNASLKARTAAIAAKARAAKTRPRVLFLLGLPGFTVGKHSYLSDLIEMAGGINVAGGVDQAYPDLSGESIVAMNPDVIIVARDTPFGADVRAREPWRSVNAVKSGRVATPPTDDILERPGPRIVEGLTWLEKAIH